MNITIERFGIALLILGGAFILFLSILRTRHILRLLKENALLIHWQRLFWLMVFFLGGYAGTLALVVGNQLSWIARVTGVVFFFGAVFVYLVARLQYLTFHGVMEKLESRKKTEQAARRVNQELEKRVQELATLNMITQAAGQSQDIQTSLDLACHAITELFQNYRTSIGLLNRPQNTEMYIAASYAEHQAAPLLSGAMIAFDPTCPICRNVSLCQTTVVSTQEASRLLDALRQRFTPITGAERVMVTPICSDGELFGVLFIETDSADQEFSSTDINIAETVAESIVGAILRDELHQAEQQLRERMRQKNEELTRSSNELKTTQYRLLQAEKMAVLGKLMAGIAHEINTPLGALRSSVGDIAKTLEQTLQHFPEFFDTLPTALRPQFFALARQANCSAATLSGKERRQARQSVAEALQQAGLAEKSHLAGFFVDMGITQDVTPYLELLRSPRADAILDMAYQLSGLRERSQTMSTGIDRVSHIIKALKNYAHSDYRDEPRLADVREGIETVLTLYHSEMKHGIEIARQYEPVEAISCYPDELMQIWTNLIHNAIQAMQGKGRLEIAVSQQQPTPCPSQEGNASNPLLGGVGGGSSVLVEITDSGPGIPDDIKSRIFEPFFTTKANCEGSGLGLDICKRIVQKHHGVIDVESQPGKTTFRVWLPRLKKDTENELSA